jgi:hypothetical protein
LRIYEMDVLRAAAPVPVAPTVPPAREG